MNIWQILISVAGSVIIALVGDLFNGKRNQAKATIEKEKVGQQAYNIADKALSERQKQLDKVQEDLANQSQELADQKKQNKIKFDEQDKKLENQKKDFDNALKSRDIKIETLENDNIGLRGLLQDLIKRFKLPPINIDEEIKKYQKKSIKIKMSEK